MGGSAAAPVLTVRATWSAACWRIVTCVEAAEKRVLVAPYEVRVRPEWYFGVIWPRDTELWRKDEDLVVISCHVYLP